MTVTTQGITSKQRPTRSHPCPICGHYDGDPRGDCHGFLADGFTYCTREEHANGAMLNEKCEPRAYVHKRTDDGSHRPWTATPPTPEKFIPTDKQRGIQPAKTHEVEPGERHFAYTSTQRVRRIDAPGEPKDVKPQHYANEDWHTGDGPGEIEFIYRRTEAAALPDEPLHIAEGEPCCDQLRDLGYRAITWRGGAPRVAKASEQLAKICAGQHVVLHTDTDVPGRKAMNQIATAIRPVAASVKIVDLFPDERPKDHGKDVQDFLATNTADALRALRALINDAPTYDPATESEPEIAPRRYATYTPSQMMERPAIRFAVENLIPSGGFASLVGAPGTYKSFIALDIAAHIAARGYWQGRDAAEGGVLYVSAEGASGIGQRIRAWETARRTAIPDTFRVMTDAPQLRDDDDVDALIATAAAVRAEIGVPLRLIVIDTFARTFDGEENSSKEVGEAIAAADRLRRESGAAVLFIHHLNKAGTGSRGSSALLGALDVEITVTRSDHSVKMEVTKAKDFGEGEPILLAARVVELEGGGSSLVLDAEKPSIDALPAAAKNVALILDDQFGELGAAQSIWKKACEEKSFASETFNRARRQLLDKGYLVAPQEGKSRNHKYRLTRTFYEAQGKAIPRWLDANPPTPMPTMPPDCGSWSVPSDLLAERSQRSGEATPSVPLGTTDVWYQQFPATTGDSGPPEDRYHSVPNEYHGTNASPEEVSTISTTTHRVGTVVPTSEERDTDSTSTAEKSRDDLPITDPSDYFAAVADD